VHLEQTGLGASPGSVNIFAITPSKMPLWSMTRNQPLGLPFSTFCHIPAADVGSNARAPDAPARANATPAIAGSSRSLDSVFRILLT
jgi:hypothetical protein